MNLDMLSDDDRIDLAVALWESVGQKGKPLELTPSQTQELDRRVAEYRADGDSGTPWRDCIQQIAERASESAIMSSGPAPEKRSIL